MSLRATRDHAMIAMLIGCGLRRGELLAPTVESVQQREEPWVIADLLGKAGHVRTVPIPLAYAKACGRNLVVYGRPAKQSQPGAEVLVAWSSVVASWTPLPEFRLVPIAVEGTTSSGKSGSPLFFSEKSVNFAVAKLFGPMTHEPSSVPMRSDASAPEPVVGALVGSYYR